MLAKKRYLLYLSGLTLFVILIWYYEVALIVQKIGSLRLPWALLAGASILVTTFLGAINAYLFIGRDRKVTFSDFLALYWISWAVGLVVPGQIGDLASIGFFLRRHSLELSTIWGRAMLDKTISLMVMLVFVLIGLLTIVKGVILDQRLLLSAALLLALAVGVVYGLRGWLRAVFDPVRAGPAGGLARIFTELMQTVRLTPSRVWLNIGITILKVILAGGAYWAMFCALGETGLPLFEVVVLATIAGLVAYLPLSINGLGTVEMAGIFLFGQLDVPAVTVITAYICLRLLVLGLAWVPAFIWIFGSQKRNSVI